MMKVRVLAWREDRAVALRTAIAAADLEVDAAVAEPPKTLKELKSAPPEAVVIDLGRSPSVGRDVGVALRIARPTRYVPLVFVDGDPAKVTRVRDSLPDAFYCGLDEAALTVRQALADPPTDPVVPSSGMAGYSGTPLPRKLGLAAGGRLTLIDAPEGFERLVEPLPDGATVERGAPDAEAIVVWFVGSTAELEKGLPTVLATGWRRLWIAWPKRTSGLESDLTQQIVRERGLADGLVDFKIAALDDTWSGLCFVRRR